MIARSSLQGCMKGGRLVRVLKTTPNSCLGGGKQKYLLAPLEISINPQLTYSSGLAPFFISENKFRLFRYLLRAQLRYFVKY